MIAAACLRLTAHAEVILNYATRNDDNVGSQHDEKGSVEMTLVDGNFHVSGLLHGRAGQRARGGMRCLRGSAGRARCS